MTQQDNAVVDILKWVVVLGVVAVVVLWALHALFGGGPGREPDGHMRVVAEQRIQPLGRVVSGEVAQAEAGGGAADVRASVDVYSASCAACHSTGVAGAPRTGQAGEWKPRLDERGVEGLLKNAINGLNGMPPRGGNPALSDEEMENAIQHILEESGLSS